MPEQQHTSTIQPAVLSDRNIVWSVMWHFRSDFVRWPTVIFVSAACAARKVNRQSSHLSWTTSCIYWLSCDHFVYIRKRTKWHPKQAIVQTILGAFVRFLEGCEKRWAGALLTVKCCCLVWKSHNFELAYLKKEKGILKVPTLKVTKWPKCFSFFFPPSCTSRHVVGHENTPTISDNEA